MASKQAPDLDELMRQMAMSGKGGKIDPFKHFYDGAKELDKAEKRGNKKQLEKLDFGVGPQCMRCSKPCVNMSTGEWKPLKCSGCKAVIYCSKACQVADWKANAFPGAPSHKKLCTRNEEHMRYHPYFISEARQFPWMRIEIDGTFSHDLCRARFGVLGSGPRFGYWSVPGGVRPHDDEEPDPRIKAGDSHWYKEYARRARPRSENHIHGEMLFAEEWPTDVEAWMLKDVKLVPRLFFTDEVPPPAKPEPHQVKNWKSWYEWRGLPLASPAAELMDFPMTLYHLLTEVLEVVDKDRSQEHRQRLLVHYIGAEVELNFLPLFSELALLLPYIDLTIVFFGKAVQSLVTSAPSDSLAKHEVVWSYNAPRRTGAGSVALKLHAKEESWTRRAVEDGRGSLGTLPDALVGLNAGLAAYPGWQEPVHISTGLAIPFAITDYAEQSLETCTENLPLMYRSFLMNRGVPYIEYGRLLRERAYPITPNPFHRPGQRPLPNVRMPNIYNGFAMPIVMKE